MPELICKCRKVSKEEILKAISRGAKNVQEVGIRSKAGTGCGSCKRIVEQILTI